MTRGVLTPGRTKRLQGTARKDRREATEPTLSLCSVPPAPATWNADAQAEWAELARLVDSLNVYTTADYRAFKAMVESSTKLERHEYATTSEFIALTKLLYFGLARFGLTPADRSRVAQLPGESDTNDLAEFMT